MTRPRTSSFQDAKNQISIKDDGLKRMMVVVLTQFLRFSTAMCRTMPGTWDVFLGKKDSKVIQSFARCLSGASGAAPRRLKKLLVGALRGFCMPAAARH